MDQGPRSCLSCPHHNFRCQLWGLKRLLAYLSTSSVNFCDSLSRKKQKGSRLPKDPCARCWPMFTAVGPAFQAVVLATPSVPTPSPPHFFPSPTPPPSVPTPLPPLGVRGRDGRAQVTRLGRWWRRRHSTPRLCPGRDLRVSPPCGLGNGSALSGLGLAQVVGSCLRS